jgi:hypothetical protein
LPELRADVEYGWYEGQKRPWTAWLTGILNTAREASSTPKRRGNLGKEGWNDQRVARRVQLRAACSITAATAAGCDT